MSRIAETAKMVAELDLKTGKFTKGVSTAVGSVGRLSGAVAKSRAVAVGLGVGLEHAAEAGIRAFGGAIKDGLDNLAQLETATTSVDAAIKQVGLTGKLTSDQVAAWGVQIETAVGSAFDDKAITASAATLLRYGKVTQDNLRPALVVMTDLAAKTGSVDSAATLLAKALADPEKAAGKLSRQGVVLTKVQQDQIKAFVKAGKTAQAQKVILDALATTTKGAALASQGPYARSLNELKDTWEEVTKALAIGFLPVIQKVRDILSTELAKPSTLANIREFGTSIATALGNLVDAAQKVPWGSIASSLKIAAGAAKSVLDAFLGLPAWVQTAVLTGWGLNKLSGGAVTGLIGSLASGLIKGVLGMTAGVVNINAAVVNGAGGLPTGGGGTGVLGALGSVGLGGAAGLGGLAAVISKEVADLTNQQFGDQGIPVHFVGPGSTGDNPLLAALPFGVGGAIQDIAEFLRIAKPPSSPAGANQSGSPDDRQTANDLRTAMQRTKDAGQSLGLSAKALKQAAAAQKTAATASAKAFTAQLKTIAPQLKTIDKTQRTKDKDQGPIITSGVKQALSPDIQSLSGKVGNVARATSTGDSRIVGAILSSRPITNVQVHVSATTVSHTTTVVNASGPDRRHAPRRLRLRARQMIRIYVADDSNVLTDMSAYVNIRVPRSLSVTENAEEQSVASSTITFDDPNGELDLVGLRDVAIDDDLASFARIWRGQMWIRRVKRGNWRAGAAARIWEADLNDLNTRLAWRVGNANVSRPAETDVERMQYLCTQPDITDAIQDVTTYVDTSAPVDMDAVQYAGQYVSDYINDCIQAAHKNCYLLNVSDGSGGYEVALWYGPANLSTYSSSTKISNVLSDVDGVTVFAPFVDGQLERSPDRVYAGLRLNFDGGYIYRVRSATDAQYFALRDTIYDAVNVKTLAKASVRTDAQLLTMADRGRRHHLHHPRPVGQRQRHPGRDAGAGQVQPLRVRVRRRLRRLFLVPRAQPHRDARLAARRTGSSFYEVALTLSPQSDVPTPPAISCATAITGIAATTWDTGEHRRRCGRHPAHHHPQRLLAAILRAAVPGILHVGRLPRRTPRPSPSTAGR